MASGTKFMKEISDQFLICKICIEPFKEPKTLSCLHSFCLCCLQKQADAVNDRPSRFYSRYLTCPLCRQKTEIPTGGIRRLPDNFLVCSLTEVVNRRQRSKVPPCEICQQVRTKSNDACSKCLDCSKLLCKACVQLHGSTKVTQKHSLIDIQEEKNIECKTHPEEIVRFYCEPCEACICVVCAFQDHRSHDVCSFSDGFAKYKDGLDLLLKKGQSRMADVDSRIKMIDNYQKVIKETRENIRDLAISYISKVRQTEKALLKKVDDLVGDNTMEFLKNRNWLQENWDNLNNTCNLTQIIMKDNGVEMLLLKQEIQAKMGTLLETDLPDLPKDVPSQIRFVPGDVKLGHISVSEGKDQIEINGIADTNNSTKFEQTQTEQIQQKQLADSVTTMSFDMTIELVDGSIQTPSVNLISRDTSTDKCQTRDKGVSVYIQDTRAKGTMTDKQDKRSLKCQTERLHMFDQETNTPRLILPSVDVMVNTPVAKTSRSSVSKGLQVQARTSTKLTNTDTIPNDADTLTSPTSPQNIRRNLDAVCNGVDIPQSETPKSWIRSRKIQTNVSAMEFHGDDSAFVNNLLNGDENHAHPNHKASVEMKDAQVNTSFNVRIVPEMFEKETSPEARTSKDIATSAFPVSKATDTQTQRVMSKDIAITTDYSGQSHKATSTQRTNSVDCYTQMMQVKLEHKVTWTDKVSTCDRATCPMCLQTSDRSTSTSPVKQGDTGIQVTPQRKIRSTNTPHISHQTQESQTVVGLVEYDKEQQSNLLSMDKLSCSLPNLAGEILTNENKESTESKCVGTNDFEWDNILNTSFISSICESVDTVNILSCEKETSTPHVHYIDQWTLTTKPQLVNTGVSPPRPATIDSETSTNPIITVDSSTHTNVVTQRESATETYISLTDNETLTERVSVVDAQIGVEIIMESVETSMDVHHFQDQGCMTSDSESPIKPNSESIGIQADILKDNTDTKGSLQLSEVGIQTNFSSVDCAVCEHQFEFSEERHQSSSCSTRPVIHKHDVGTMAMSVSSCLSEVIDHGTQTLHVRLLDKSIGTSLDLEDMPPSLSLEHRDAATSTESLPYIGLLSELDVDDLIVVPEAHFDLLSIYSTDDEDVEMVDDETCTDIHLYVEDGTQTPFTVQSPEPSPTLPTGLEDSKHLVSVGVNTVSKMTFEKETCTPIRHLFSKGTMTFYISKTDKSTSTFSHTRQIAETKYGGCVHKSPSVPKIIVEHKNTMTSVVEYKDIAIETDSTLLDGKITKCISKLRNVSEKLNSPTFRQSSDDIFFGKSFAGRLSDSSDQSSSTLHDSMTSSREEKHKQGSPADKPEFERQKQIQQLLAETQAILNTKDSTSSNKIRTQESPKQVTEHHRQKHHLLQKEKQSALSSEREPNLNTNTDSLPNQHLHQHDARERQTDDSQTNSNRCAKVVERPPGQTEQFKPEKSPGRKAQPITTLKGRGPDKNKNSVTFETHSLPRQFSGDSHQSVKMGNQLIPPSRLPLLRYNSAPGRIATVPTQKLQDMQKSRYSPVRTSPQRGSSPSKIPIKAAVCDPVSNEVVYSPKSASKSPQPRPSLPSISEARTLSSCSDTSTSSFVSADSGDSGTPSLTISTITTSSDQMEASAMPTTSSRSSAETSSIGSGDYADDGCKASDGKHQKKSGSLNFMQRLLSKKKKEPEPEVKPEPKSGTPGAKYRVKQTPPEQPKPPAAPKKARAFVYVRQRIFSIQHDNEDEMNEKRKDKNKQKKLEQSKNGKKGSQSNQAD
ncbi:uncharacterized protein LOC121369766 [Gigantopelta aegis]|uniref:uncharacterized protein LOC121369766 n=1 Tax=Gigantopelta aegis TaxID=1735272 RepID=UPI001B8880D1|nr:uncharacterized protein LOC121369766 [Gigantopelta aegis]